MSDIPDWLVELAAQQGEGGEEEQGQEGQEDTAFEDALSAEAETQTDVLPDVAALTPLEDEGSSPPEETDLVQELRSQVAVEGPLAASEEVGAFSDRHRGVLVGLQPWQQFVLALLLFLDVAVIGLLILVMLGRVVIP